MNENRRSAKHNKKSKLSCFWCKQKNKKERKKTSKSGEKRSGGGGKWQHRGDRFGCEKAKESENPLTITPRVSKNFAIFLSPLLGWIEFPPASTSPAVVFFILVSEKKKEKSEKKLATLTHTQH